MTRVVDTVLCHMGHMDSSQDLRGVGPSSPTVTMMDSNEKNMVQYLSHGTELKAWKMYHSQYVMTAKHCLMI